MPGAAVATLAMFLPSCLLVHLLGAVLAADSRRPLAGGGRARPGAGRSRPHLRRRAGADARAPSTQPSAYAITVIATVLLSATRLHPLLVLRAGAAAGWAIGA